MPMYLALEENASQLAMIASLEARVQEISDMETKAETKVVPTPSSGEVTIGSSNLLGVQLTSAHYTPKTSADGALMWLEGLVLTNRSPDKPMSLELTGVWEGINGKNLTLPAAFGGGEYDLDPGKSVRDKDVRFIASRHELHEIGGALQGSIADRYVRVWDRVAAKEMAVISFDMDKHGQSIRDYIQRGIVPEDDDATSPPEDE